MSYSSRSKTKSIFRELIERLTLFSTEGTRGPYAAAMGWEEYETMLRNLELKRQREHLRRLKQQKLLKILERGDQLVIALTKKGKMEYLKDTILFTKKTLPQEKLCIVSFDVPEDARDARAALRWFLKKAGFERIHKSVWCTERDVAEPLAQLLHILRLERWVRVFIVESQMRSHRG